MDGWKNSVSKRMYEQRKCRKCKRKQKAVLVIQSGITFFILFAHRNSIQQTNHRHNRRDSSSISNPLWIFLATHLYTQYRCTRVCVRVHIFNQTQ